jgi:hypothetical protein
MSREATIELIDIDKSFGNTRVLRGGKPSAVPWRKFALWSPADLGYLAAYAARLG